MQMQKLLTCFLFCFFWVLPIVKPIINEIKLPSVVRVFRGYPEVLVCEAEGNPKPTISWQSNGIVLSTHSEKLNITESTPVNVNCTASNSVGTDTRQVKVSIQGNYAFVCHFPLTMFQFSNTTERNCGCFTSVFCICWSDIKQNICFGYIKYANSYEKKTI